MKVFSNPRAKRSTVFMVLLAWLAPGATNACFLQAQETHAHSIASAEFSVASHGDEAHASTAPCLKVCDDGARSVPKPDLKISQTDPGPAPLLVVLRTAAVPVALAPDLNE